MIQLPNLGLWGQFEPCEEGILEKINQNFQVLDTLVQLSVIDIVDELPLSPTVGDRYILVDMDNDGTIAVFTDSGWEYYIPEEGDLAYVIDQGFFWYNGTEWENLIQSSDIQITIPNNTANFGTGIMLDETKYVSYTIRLCGYRQTDTPVNLRALLTFDLFYKEGVGWMTPERQMRPEDLGIAGTIVAGEFCITTSNIAGANYEGKGTLRILDKSQIEV